MGDRRNVVFDFGGNAKIYLYSHSWGYSLAGMLARALDANHTRWDDSAYLTRFLVTHIVAQAGSTLSEYGWGLSPFEISPDYEHNIVVDLNRKTVTIKKTRTFEEFVQKHKDDQ